MEISKRELHELVWTKPVSVVAGEFGVSDVALAKACKNAGIPLPGRGHWQRVAAGKDVGSPAPPPRGLGEGFYVAVGADKSRASSGDDAIDAPIPEVPDFGPSAEEMTAAADNDVRRAIRAAKGHIPEVEKLLEADEVRARENAGSPYDGPLFASQFEQRRLRVVSRLARSLRQLGHAFTLRGKNPFTFSVRVGDIHFQVVVDAPETKYRSAYGSFGLRERMKTAKEPLTIAIVEDYGEHKKLLSWVDDATGRVEERLHEVLIGMLRFAEEELRRSYVRRREHAIRFRDWAIEQRKERLEKEAKAEKRRTIRAQQRRVAKLIGEANSLRLAGDIRAYVAEVGRSIAPEDGEAYEIWAAAALAQANAIDPLLARAWREAFSEEEEPDQTPKNSVGHGTEGLVPGSQDDSHWLPWFVRGR